LKVYAERDVSKSGVYAFENAARKLSPTDEKKFKSNKGAWTYFTKQAPSYQRSAIWWVTGAKKEETRERRLALLIEDSANGRILAQYTWSKKKPA
jgi:uncharacterized protein YdeI (YjbR/CyaY-like superfamily)